MILSWLWHFFGVIFASSFMYHGYYSNLKRLEILIYILFEFKHSYNFFYSQEVIRETQVSGVGFSTAGLDRAKFVFNWFQIFLFIVVILRPILLKVHFDKFNPESVSCEIFWRSEVNRFKGETVSNTLRRLAPIFQGLTLFVFDAS